MRDIVLNATIYIDFTTRAFASGVPTVLAGTPVLSVLEENNATPITAGVSVSVDRATVVGLNEATIVATTANGYETGKSYSIYISTGTVGGVSVVGEVVGQFTIEQTPVNWNKVTAPTTAVDLSATDIQLVDTVTTYTGNTLQTADVAARVPNVLNTTATGNIGVDWANIENPTTAQNLSGTNIDVDQIVASVSGAVGSVTGAVGSVTADVGITATAVDNIHDELLSGHQTQGSFGAAITMAAYMGPHGPGIYIDDAAANTGTTIGDDGTLENPVSTIAAALTISGSMGVKRIYLINNSGVTLGAAMKDYEFIGIGDREVNSIVLGSQDVDGSHFTNMLISGAQGGVGYITATKCALSSLTGLLIRSYQCSIVNNLQVAGDCYFDYWSSAIAGSGTPDLDINSVVGVDISMRHGSGGIQISNAVSSTTMSVETDGQIIVAITCTSLSLTYRGCCSLTDNGTTTSITELAGINLANISGEINDALDTAISELGVAAPTATPTLRTGLMLLYMALRNKTVVQTSATDAIEFYDDAGTLITKKLLTDDGSDMTEAEMS